MPPLNANVARYHFETAALPPEVFQVARFRGVEEVSRLFRYELELVSTDAYVDFASVVNQPATFTLMRGGEAVPIHGLVVDFRQEGRSKDYVAYRVILAPRLWKLSLTYQSRIFQHLTLEEIITQVLEEAGLAPADFQFELSGTYTPLDYVVQFCETDLNFICRLMEKYGIFFFYKHDDDLDKLVIMDNKEALEAIAGESTLDYHEVEGMAPPDVEVVHEIVCREQIVTGKVVLKDYNYETPDDALKVESQLNGEMPGTYYEYGAHYKDTGEGETLAQIRNEEIESRRRVLEGSSTCVGFRCGFTYSLDNHYRNDFNEDYLLLWVSQEGSQRHALGLDALPGEATKAGVTYANAFRCIPVEQPFRPERRTPVPQIPGVMIAKTEHPDRNADDYGHLDDQGRYRAKMNFDLAETEPADATKPLRMNQPYSGPSYGIHFPNHDSTEMIWACVNGDVDRPMALGTVPNPNQGSPSTVGNKWQSVIRTWGKNELTFDDKVGEENIYMFATKDHTVKVTNNETISVGNDQAISVGHDRTKSVGNDETNTIQTNRTTDIKDGDDKLTVHTGDRIVSVNTGDKVLNVLTGDRTVNVNTGDDTHNVKTGDRTVTINAGDDTLKVLTGKKTDTVKGPYEITVNQDHFKIKCGQSELVLGHDGTITLKGVNIGIEGSSTVNMNGTSSVNISGGNITSEADQNNSTKGAMVISHATSNNIVKGDAMVMLNP